MRFISLSLILFPLFLGLNSFAKDLDEARAQKILEAFNAQPEKLVNLLELSAIHLHGGVGRVDVNEESKFSYYIQTENPGDIQSKILLIPMATSRYTPSYYQTDQWWNEHKSEIDQAKQNGTLPPRQDQDEVKGWLRDMKLSTNPDVILIDHGKAKRQTLQDYLLNYLVTNYATPKKTIRLYRGAEREDETASWAQGERPKGVRYWTPTANYAWRYARKNSTFIAQLLGGQAPLLVFEMPIEKFKAMVKAKRQQLTLGTELTKSVHDYFDSEGRFLDPLNQQDYLGDGKLGVEIEIRSNSSGADAMLGFYKGTITIDQLAQDKEQVIRRATERLIRQKPQDKKSLQKLETTRLQNIALEVKVLKALKNKAKPEVVRSLMAQLHSDELTNIIGFNFADYVEQTLSDREQEQN